MHDRPIWQLSAESITQLITSGELTAAKVVRATVKRMRNVNGQLNAIVDDLGDEAIEQAEEMDRIQAKSGVLGPLHGVPVTIKENVDQKGRATPNGVAAYANVMAPADAPLVRSLKRDGAIVIGRSNTPEFSFRATTTNDLHGRTFNPWNDWATAGGSSGGSAAATMGGMGPIAHGNDIGGSLRFPSAACGAVTVKPGLGRIPAYNPSSRKERGLLAQIMSVQGVICREVCDVRMAMRSIVNYDPNDPWQAPVPWEGVDPNNRKIGYTRETYQFDADPAVLKALEVAANCLADAGYELVEIDPPSIREIGETGFRALMSEVETLLMPDIRKDGSAELNGIFSDYFELFPPFSNEELMQQLAKRSHYVREWNLLLEQYPLILSPFLPFKTPTWNRDSEGLAGVTEMLGSGLWSFSMNYLGLPAGIISPITDNGMPVAIQVVGRRFREDLILKALEEIETRCGVIAHQLFDQSENGLGWNSAENTPHLST